LTATDPAFTQRLAREKPARAPHRSSDGDAAGLQRRLFAARPAGDLWAFVDNFYMFGLLALGGIPLVSCSNGLKPCKSCCRSALTFSEKVETIFPSARLYC